MSGKDRRKVFMEEKKKLFTMLMEELSPNLHF